MSGKLNYTKCVVFVHGKSEQEFVKFIYTNLHLSVKIISKDNGKHSIQINGLIKFINKHFKSLEEFADKYAIEYDEKAKELLNFKIFTIMDTDDCNEEIKDKYISGELFKRHALSKYIVPIYNIKNMEDVMMRAGIMIEKIKNSEKGTYYSKIFPVNTSPKSIDTLNQVRAFAKKIKGINQTNMLEFIEYCFDQLQNENLWD